MKIVFYDYVFDPALPGKSGLSDVVWDMAQGFARLGHEVHIVGPYPSSDIALDGVKIHRQTISSWSMRNAFTQALMIYNAALYIKNHIKNVDVIHVPEYYSAAILTLILNTPVILTTPGHIHERIKSGYNGFDPFFTVVLKVAVIIASKRCARVIAISNEMKQYWISTGVKENKINVIPYGIDVPMFCEEKDLKHLLPEWWDNTRKNIVFVGRLSREKGIDLLIQAYANLLKTHTDLQLHIFGSGDETTYTKLAQTLNVSSNIKFHGWVQKSHIPAIYRYSYASIVPSYSEPLGRVVLEAMASNTAVIGSRVGGIPDFIRHHETGLLFEKGNLEDLTHQLEWLIMHPHERNALAAAGADLVCQNFSWDLVCAKIDQLVHTSVRERTRME